MASTLGNDTTGLGIFEPSQPHVVLDTEGKLVMYLDEYTAVSQSLYISMHGRNMSKDGEIHAITIQAFTNKGQSQPTIAVIDVKALAHKAFTTVSARNPSTSLRFLLESPAYRKWFFDCRKASESLFNLFGITMSNVYSIQLLKNAVDIMNLRDDAAEIPKLVAKYVCLDSELGLDEDGLEQYRARKRNVNNPQAEHTGPISDALVAFSVQDVTCLRKLHLVLEKKANTRAQLAIRNASNAQCKNFAAVDVPDGGFTESPFTRKAFMTVEELRRAAGSAMIDPEDLHNLHRPSNIPPQEQNRYNTEPKSTSKGARRRRNRNRNRNGQAQNSPGQNLNGYNQNGYNQNGYSHNGYNQANHQSYYQGGHHPNQQPYGPGNYAQNNYGHMGQYHVASSAVPMFSHTMNQLHIQHDASLYIGINMVGYSPAMNNNGPQQAPLQPRHHHHHQYQPAPLPPPVPPQQLSPAPDTDEARMKARHDSQRLRRESLSKKSSLDPVNNRLLTEITYLEQSDPPATAEQIMELAAKLIKRANEVMPESKELKLEMAREVTTLKALRDLEDKFASYFVSEEMIRKLSELSLSM